MARHTLYTHNSCCRDSRWIQSLPSSMLLQSMDTLLNYKKCSGTSQALRACSLLTVSTLIQQVVLTCRLSITPSLHAFKSQVQAWENAWSVFLLEIAGWMRFCLWLLFTQFGWESTIALPHNWNNWTLTGAPTRSIKRAGKSSELCIRYKKFTTISPTHIRVTNSLAGVWKQSIISASWLSCHVVGETSCSYSKTGNLTTR